MHNPARASHKIAPALSRAMPRCQPTTDTWSGVMVGTHISSLSPAPCAAGGLVWSQSRIQPTHLSQNMCVRWRGLGAAGKLIPPSWEGKDWIRPPQPGAKGAGWSTARGTGTAVSLSRLSLSQLGTRVNCRAGTGARWPRTAPAALAPAASAGEESSGRWVSQSTKSLITSFFQPVSFKETIKRSSLGVTHGVGTPKAAPSGSGG